MVEAVAGDSQWSAMEIVLLQVFMQNFKVMHE